MPGPWEDYAPTATQTVGGPWEDYGKKPWEDYAPKKKTLEQIKASVGPSSESEVPLATKVGAAIEPWVASITPQNLWNQVERGASAVGNAMAWPAYKLAGIPTEQRKPFVIDTQNNVLSQPAGTESTLPYKPGVPTLPAPLKDADVNPISEVINNFVQGASTPGGIATLPAFAAGGASSKVAQALLATQMIPGAAEQAQVALSPEATPHERAVAGMQALLSGLFGLGATKGVLEKPSALTVGKPVPDVTYPLPRIEDLSTQEQPVSAASALLPQFAGGPYPAENTKLVNAGGGVMDLTQLSPVERAALDQRTRQVYRLRGEEVGPRPAQAETPIIGQQPQQSLIRQVQLEQGGEVRPVSQATRAPVEPSGGEVSFRAPAAAEAIPNAQQVALPGTVEAGFSGAPDLPDTMISQVRRIVSTKDRLELENIRKEVQAMPGAAAPGQRTDALRLINQRENELATGQLNPEMERIRRIIAKVPERVTQQGLPLPEVKVSPPEQKLIGEQSASPIRSNQENLSQEGLQPTGGGGPRSENLQQHAEEGKSPSDTLQRQEGQAPIEQRGPLGGNVSTFGLLDPSEWKRMGQDVKDATREVGKTFDKLNNDRRYLGTAWGRQDKKGEIAATRDAVDNTAHNLGVQAENSVTLEARRVFGKSSDAALKGLIAVVEARGDKGKLVTFEKQAAKSPEALQAVRFARTNWDQLQQLAKKADALDKMNLASAELAGVKIPSTESYIKRMYEQAGEGLIFRGGAEHGTGKASKLSRKFETLFDAIEAGHKPVSWNAAALIGKRTTEIQLEANLKTWADSFKSVQDPVTKQPIATELEAAGNNRFAPKADYVSIELTPGNRVGVLKGYESIFDALTGHSRISGSTPGTFALQATGAIKHGTLAFDSFHASRIAQFRKSLGVEEGYKKGLSLLEYSEADLKEAVKQGFLPKEAETYVKEAVEVPQGKLTRRDVAKLGDAAGLNVGRNSEALYTSFVRTFPILKQTVGAFNRFVFDKLSRGAMEEAFQVEFERLGNAHPEWSKEQVARSVARDINFRMGNLGRQGVFKSRSMQDLLQLAFLAPRWIESMAQTELRSAVQAVKFVTPGSGSFGTRGTLLRSTGNLLGVYVLGTQVLNYLTTGHTTLENEEGHKLDAWIPPVGKDSKGFWLSPLSVVAEVTHDMVRYMEKGDTSLQAGARILSNKLGPLGRAEETLRTGATWKGQVDDTWDRVKEAAFAAGNPTPLPVRQAFVAAKEKDVVPFERQAFATAGLKAEPETTTEQLRRLGKDKTLEQRQAEATKRKDEQEPRTRQETVQSANYAVKAVAKRAEEMQARLPKEQQRWLADNKLVLPGHENKVHTDAADVVMTEKENKAFEALLLTGYKEMIKTLQEDPEFKKLATHSERVHVFGHYMSAARANAAGEIIGQMDAVKAKK